MNSIRSLERALTYEVERQMNALEAGEPLVQETRHWDEDAGITKSMRSKEEAFDYRYFPEPDIPPMEPSTAWIDEIRGTIPELPRARRARYGALGLRPETARVLVADTGAVALFEGALALGADPVAAANWITQDVAALRNAAGDDGALDGRRTSPTSSRSAPTARSPAPARSRPSRRRSPPGTRSTGSSNSAPLAQVSDAGALGALADAVIAEHPDVVEKFRGGKEGVIGFLVGQLMQKAGGTADPKLAQDVLRERLQG